MLGCNWGLVHVAGVHVVCVQGAVADADDTAHHSGQQQEGQKNSPPVSLGWKNIKHILDRFNGSSETQRGGYFCMNAIQSLSSPVQLQSSFICNVNS